MKLFAKRAAFARIFGGAVISQALLSVINLLTGLVLIRRAPQAQYGYYVLIAAATPVLAQLQNQLITPLLTTRVTVSSDEERKNFLGGLIREQRHLVALVAVPSLIGCALVWLSGVLKPETAMILLTGVIAGLAMLFREFFRLVMVTYRRPYDVLRADIVFAILLIGGIWLSTLASATAALAALSLAFAALVGGWLLSRSLWRHDPWNPHGSPGAFMSSVRLGTWVAAGAVIHWVFNQGYSYIVAARLDVTAVAAIAATRLLFSPLGVFSLGISSIMFSTSTLWLKHHGSRGLLRRLLLFTLAMAGAAIAYFGVMWWARDWIFLHILKRDYPQRDLLLFIWSLVFLCTVIRDQSIYLLIAKGHFKRLAGLTLFCAVFGVTVTFMATGRFGAAGGLLGLLAGEFAHVVGVIVMTVHDMRAEVPRAGRPQCAVVSQESIAPPGTLYIPSLDGIRAISFFLVFFSHAGFGNIVPGGFGVSIFFLLSGFLITTLLRTEYQRYRRISLGSFYLRRVLRILPPLYVALALAMVLCFIARGAAGIPFAGTLAQALQVSNYYQIYAVPAIIMPGSGVLWSLAIEEHFYLLFPVLYVWMCPRFSAHGQTWILLTLCAAALAWRCILHFHFDASSIRTQFGTDTRFDSILLGCVFAIIANPVLRDPLHDTLLRQMKWLLPLAGLVLLATFLGRSDNLRETFRYTLQGFALIPLFIAAIHYQKSWPVRLLNLPFVRFLGVLSYTLYLCHSIILESLGGVWTGNPGVGCALALACALGFATLVHYGIERPCTNIRKRLSKALNV